MNCDGIEDIIIGAPYYGGTVSDGGPGKAYLHYGAADGLPQTPDWTYEGTAVQRLRYAVSTTGAVNGDGCADIIVSSPYYQLGRLDEAGAIYVFHGAAGGPGTTPDAIDVQIMFWERRHLAGRDAGAPTQNLFLNTYSIFGEAAFDHYGWSVDAAGDVNGDGYGDVIVGAPGHDNPSGGQGHAYVYYGGAGGLRTTPAWNDEGDAGVDAVGSAVSGAGDVNADHHGDVIVGAPRYDNGQEDEGRAYVWHGSAGGPDATADWVTEIDVVDARFGESVSTAGDVNGDGYADVIVGAPVYEDIVSRAGGAFVYFGGSRRPERVRRLDHRR